MSEEGSDLGRTPQKNSRKLKEIEDTPEESARKEKARKAQRDRRSRQKEELMSLQLKYNACIQREPLLKSELYHLSQKTENALAETEKLKKLVNVLSDQLKETNATNGVLESQVGMWKDSYCQLLQRTTMMASVAKRSAEEAALDDFQRQRRVYNPRFQQ